MKIVTGVIEEIYIQEGTATARVKVRNSFIHAPLFLLSDARVGDEVVVDSGMIVSTVGVKLLEEV